MLKMRSEGTTRELPEDIQLPPSFPVEQEDLGFLDFLLIITQRKKLVGIVTAICMGIALILAFGLPEEYTATVKTVIAEEWMAEFGVAPGIKTSSFTEPQEPRKRRKKRRRAGRRRSRLSQETVAGSQGATLCC